MNKLTALMFSAVCWCAPVLAIDVVEVQSKKGIRAYLAEDHTNPIIAVSFLFNGGAALDPVEKMGLSYMATRLLDEGAGDLDSFAFQSQLEDFAIGLSFNTDQDFISGNLTTVTDNEKKAFFLLGLALTAPRFDPEPIERIRRQILVQLKRDQQSPNYLASRALMGKLFGDHPYARSTRGIESTINSIASQDLSNFVATRFARDRLIIGVSGDITPDRLGQFLDEVFGSLPNRSTQNWRLSKAAIPLRGSTTIVEKRFPQSVARFAQPGIARNHPDWYIATVVEHIFGGGSFTSRLMDEVREKRGLAYGVSARLAPWDAGPMIVGSVATRNDQMAESLEVIRSEWARIQKDGPSTEEVSDAILYLTGAWPLRFTSTTRVAQTLLAIQRNSLGVDYLDRRNGLIEEVTVEDTQRVARQLYTPDALTVVVVGQPAGVVAEP